VGRLDPVIVGKVIHANRGQIHYCYESARGHAPANKGSVVAHFVVTTAGTVSQVTMEKTTLRNALVETCVLSRVARWIFPKPKGGGEASVTYPFMFAPLP
jgi:outer membrane biosynthesis protein TonB